MSLFSCVDCGVFPSVKVSFTLLVDCVFLGMIVQSILVCLYSMWLHPYPTWLYWVWMCLLAKKYGSLCVQYDYALTLSGSLSRYINCLSRLTCPFGDKIKSEKFEYMVDSNIGCDYLLLISNVHYFIMLLLYMAFNDSQGPNLTQWIMEH